MNLNIDVKNYDENLPINHEIGKIKLNDDGKILYEDFYRRNASLVTFFFFFFLLISFCWISFSFYIHWRDYFGDFKRSLSIFYLSIFNLYFYVNNPTHNHSFNAMLTIKLFMRFVNHLKKAIYPHSLYIYSTSCCQWSRECVRKKKL